MKKNYLDELVNMVIHHLVRGNAGDFLQFLRGHKIIGTSQGRLSVSPNTGSHLLFTLLACLTLLMSRGYLLDRQGRRRNQTLVQGRGGQTLFCYFFFLVFFNNPQPTLTNAREGLVFLCLDLGIEFLIKLSCHFCKKKRNNTEVWKRRRKGQKERIELTIFFCPKVTYFFLHCKLRKGCKRKALVPSSDELGSGDPLDHQSRRQYSHTQQPHEHILQTCPPTLDDL